jgi:hypothetical protein
MKKDGIREIRVPTREKEIHKGIGPFGMQSLPLRATTFAAITIGAVRNDTQVHDIE